MRLSNHWKLWLLVFSSIGTLAGSFDEEYFSRGEVNTSGLVALHKLNELSGTTTADSSGRGNTGTITGTVPRVAGCPTIEVPNPAAFQFNGTNNYINCGMGSSLNFGTGSFTIMAWIYPLQSNVLQIISDKGDNGSSGYWLGLENRYTNKSAIAFNVSSYSVNTAAVEAVSNIAQYNRAAWNHVAAVYSSTTHSIQLYFNGLPVNTVYVANSRGGVTNILSTDITNSVLYIGCYQDLSFKFNGYVDDHRLYARALTGAEIYQIGAAGTR